MADLSGIDPGTAGPEDADQLLALINEVQPHVPWTAEHLQWQFFGAPAGPARLYVMRDQGRIVALYSAVQQRVKAAGRIRPAWMVQDVMTLPPYRGRGFLHYLGEQCLADIRRDDAAGYTFPNKQSEGSFRRTGWDLLHAVPLRTMEVGTGAALPDGIAPVADFDAAHAAAWDASDAGAGVHRDLGFLRWRYTKPAQKYERFTLGDGQGYMVLKEYRSDSAHNVHICDLVTRADARSLVQPAVEYARAHAAAAGARTLTAWLPADHPYAATFDAAGLTLQPGHDRLFFVTGSVTMPWHLTQGDSDVY